MTQAEVDQLKQGQTPPQPTVTYGMTLTEYAEWTRKMWLSRTLESRDFTIMSLGLPEEAGEVAGILKKFVRDGNLDQMKLKKELGDVLYYWAMICNYFGFDPEEIVVINVEKIEGRHARGTLRGSGDDR
jgi:NTP pyrophosphatase (non-canonical NTP hydrolase)